MGKHQFSIKKKKKKRNHIFVGVRKMRYQGTNQGTKGTKPKSTFYCNTFDTSFSAQKYFGLVPHFPHKLR